MGSRTRLCLVAMVMLAIAFAAGASPASAILRTLPNGRNVSYEGMSGASSALSPHIFDAHFTNLDYSGGPVMASNTNVVVEWKPSNYSGHGFKTGYVPGVGQFLSDTATDSGHATNSDAVATQYNDQFGNAGAYASTYGGTLLDQDPLPSNGCSQGPTCLTDAQIEAELNKFLSSNGEPAGFTNEYFLLTPPDVVTCFDASGTACSGQAPAHGVFCAYHSITLSAYIYANIPDLDGLPGCDPFVTDFPCNVSTCDYPNSPADGMLSAVSHEHVESITDPLPNTAWTDWGGSGDIGNEIGDKCNSDQGQDPATNNNPQLDGNDAPFNQTINGTGYWIQREWSNQLHQCMNSFTPNGTAASASFTASPGSGTTVNFDASASTATGNVKEYVWQFNDGPGTTLTQETTHSTISHTFATAGKYTVALTVMAGDGTGNGAAQDVHAGAPLAPTAAFTLSPDTVLEGGSVAFNASGSKDTNQGGHITSYSWDFGDGSQGAGASASHVYSHHGTYLVTLEVKNNFNIGRTVGETVTVTDEPPTATFAAPSVLAGDSLSFHGSGFDPDGSITSFAWSFGDGHSSAGTNTSHAFALAGPYHVRLTVTDSDHGSASVSHTVTVASSCVVPKLRHKPLKGVRRVLGKARCALGKVTKPRKKPPGQPPRHKKWALVISREFPKGGAVASTGTKVALKAVWAAVRR